MIIFLTIVYIQIRINILEKEPVYNPDDICNIKIINPFFKPSDGYKKIIEYEKLVGKKLNLLILLDGLEIVGCIHQINNNVIIIIFLKFKQCNKKM